MRKRLDEAIYISLTVDPWSDRRLRTFIGITAHFIDKTFNFVTMFLAVEPIDVKKSAENIKAIVDKTLTKFEIKSKVVKIVTDNGSNMIKMGFLHNLINDNDESDFVDDNNNEDNDNDDGYDDDYDTADSDDSEDETQRQMKNEKH